MKNQGGEGCVLFFVGFTSLAAVAAFWRHPGILLAGLGVVLLLVGLFRFAAWVMFDGCGGGETVEQALKRAGKDGRPRNFILKDGSIYSGQVYQGPGTGGATDVNIHTVERVEYPE